MATILIVDDELELALSLKTYLEDEGFEVLLAGSGEEALTIAGLAKIDIAVIDMRLPGMDGNETIVDMVDDDKDIRFLIHTGSTEYSLPEALQEIGMTRKNIFYKPMSDMGVLVERINNLLI
ncbi:MAG: response regulator [Thermodesulfobacteriota bacterium]